MRRTCQLFRRLRYLASNLAIYSFHRNLDIQSTCTTPAPHISPLLLYAASFGGYHKLVHITCFPNQPQSYSQCSCTCHSRTSSCCHRPKGKPSSLSSGTSTAGAQKSGGDALDAPNARSTGPRCWRKRGSGRERRSKWRACARSLWW